MEKCSIKIFVYAPAITPQSGGNSIMHTLCHYLNSYSIFNSYLIPYNDSTKEQMGSNLCAKEEFKTDDRLNCKVFNNDIQIDYEKDFIIYNESIMGNPLDFKNIIRWILYFPHDAIYESFSCDDIILFFLPCYLRNLFELSNVIYHHPDIIDYLNDDLNEDDIFFAVKDYRLLELLNTNNLNDNNYNKFIYTKRKSYGIYSTPQYPQEELNIIGNENNLIENKPLNIDNINHAFSESGNFYSYDLYTFLNTLALKAGINSYVHPNKFIHKDDWKYGVKWMNGIKYGLNDPEDCIYENIDFEDFNIKNIKKLENKILKRINFAHVRFTEPMINLFNKEGLSYNEFDCNLNLNSFSIEVFFEIKTFDFQYQNIFDLNYKNTNKGPRLEINSNGGLAIILTNPINNEMQGYLIENKIELNTIYFLKINFKQNQFLYNLNNKLGEFNINYNKNFYFSNITIGGGFNEDRKFKSNNLYSFKLYNYNIPIIREINHYLPDFDVFMKNHPKKICNFYYKYNDLNIKYKYYFESIVFSFIMNLFPQDSKIIIRLNEELILFHENNYIKLKINNEIYNLFNFEFVKKYDIIISIDFINKKLVYSINKIIYNIELINNNNGILINNILIKKFLNNLSIGNYNINNILNFDKNDANSMINYYNTYGFLKLSNLFINSNEILIKAFIYNTLNFSVDIKHYIPRAMENLEYFVNLLLNKKIHYVLEKIFNKKYFYTGSDSKLYSTNTNWHCDRKTKNHYLKVAFYLDKLNETNGCLRVLPGSQHFGVFNKVISKYTIPLFLGSGGFKDTFINHIKDNEMPSFNINIDYGDALIFNLGLYHSAFNNTNNKKMICMNYSESYDDINDSEKLECVNSDFNIISNYTKNLDLNQKIGLYDNNFINYIKNNNNIYEKYFKDYNECNHSLDQLCRLTLQVESYDSESYLKREELMKELSKNTTNTNMLKNQEEILINNRIY